MLAYVARYRFVWRVRDILVPFSAPVGWLNLPTIVRIFFILLSISILLIAVLQKRHLPAVSTKRK